MEDCDSDVIGSRVAVAYVTQFGYHILLHLGCDYIMALKKTNAWIYYNRVGQNKWRKVERKFLPGCSQPQPTTPGWCLAKQSLFLNKPVQPSSLECFLKILIGGGFFSGESLKKPKKWPL